MKPTLLQRIDLWTRNSAPVVLTFVLAIIAVIPLKLPGYALVAPDLLLVAVFYWVAHRPDLMPPVAIFVIALFGDLLSGASLGLNSLLLLLVHGAVLGQRKTLRGRPFAIAWLAFAVVALCAKAAGLLLNLVLRGGLMGLDLFALQLTLTIAVYPMLAWPLARAQRAFVPA